MKYVLLALFTLTMGMIGTAQAAAVVVTGTVTDIAAQLAPIALIGTAVLGIFVALKAYKWVRRSLA